MIYLSDGLRHLLSHSKYSYYKISKSIDFFDALYPISGSLKYLASVIEASDCDLKNGFRSLAQDDFFCFNTVTAMNNLKKKYPR